MLSLADPIWRQLEGGNRVPYDASGVLSRMERGESWRWVAGILSSARC
jgi:hypothetical protein